MVGIKWLERTVLIAGLLALATTGAQAVTLNITAGGMEATNANYGCPTAPGTCVLAARDYSLVAPAIAIGQIVINPAGTVVAISLSVTSATFSGPGGPISFGPATYLATLSGPSVVTTPIGPGTGGISSGFGTGSVSGSANATAFAVSPNVSISCNYPGGTGQCGITFGEAGFTNVIGHDWRHTFNVTVVQSIPEPTTGLLVVLGLAGLALRSHRA